ATGPCSRISRIERGAVVRVTGCGRTGAVGSGAVTPSDDDPDGRGPGSVPSGWEGVDRDATSVAPRPDGQERRGGAAERKVAPRQYFVPAGAGTAESARTDPAAAPRAAEARGSVAAPPAAPPRGPTSPGRSPEPGPEPRPRARRRRWGPRRVVAAVLLVLVVLVVAFLLFMLWQFNRIDRVPVGDTLASGGRGTNYLIVG